MDAAQRLTALTAAVDAISANGTNLAAEVECPTCPGWTVEDVVDHLGRVYLWTVEATRGTERPSMGEREQGDLTLGEWYADCGRRMLDRLREADPAAGCWTFDRDDRTVRFWIRRQLHETTIHWVDLARAHGIEAEISDHVADDGIDELLHLFVPRRIEDPQTALPLPLQIRATDTGSVWWVQEADGVVSAGRGEEGESVAEIRGEAVELYLALWGRNSREALHVDGEAAPARGFLAQQLCP